MEKENNFFIGLPASKMADSRGFCQPKEYDDDPNNGEGGVVVNLYKDCTNCQIGECHMFKPVYGENNQIIAREYKHHPSAY